MNISDQLLNELQKRGYTHCFFLAGGNIMHLLDSARKRFTCIPVLHEMSGVIAAEYFNASQDKKKAFCLVTAGPGLTNAVTGIAGSWLESRSVLVIGGQVKSSDLKKGELRQNGIQEIDGVALVKTITKAAIQFTSPKELPMVLDTLQLCDEKRPGPVFIEICIDVQAAPALEDITFNVNPASHLHLSIDQNEKFQQVRNMILNSNSPVLLIGGGVDRDYMQRIQTAIRNINLPVMTTWNGADRVDSRWRNYWGRPNTWGMRYSNILIQQSDLVIAVGTRLGLQQTGFAWEEFVPHGQIIQVDIDKNELTKNHPNVNLPLEMDAKIFLDILLEILANVDQRAWEVWLNYGNSIKEKFPLSERSNEKFDGYWNPYDFFALISNLSHKDDILVPCSSGSAFTTFMQAFQQKIGQVIISNKGLASMGYGLAGAIGAAAANQNSRVMLFEGDGGFLLNLQEVGTLTQFTNNLKVFIFDNGGYASIRTTQNSYFKGSYVGCDSSTGLGLPNWMKLFEAFHVKSYLCGPNDIPQLEMLLKQRGPMAFIIPIHVDQTYFPKIQSKVLSNGSMKSAPLHELSPEVTWQKFGDYLTNLQLETEE